MIINTVRAENVLKYATLSIDLHDKKLIAIQGPNESGKSSIGETVCFGLFGRTFSIGPEELPKVVRWGETRCSATLGFSVGDTKYEISRFLDRDGHQSAKLSLAASPDDPIARGVEGVAAALQRILGFGYEQFVESFYLAQREISSPQPHNDSVRTIAGVATLEQIAQDLGAESATRETALEEIRTNREAVERDLAALGIDEHTVPNLAVERHTLDDRIARISTLTEDINRGRDTCLENGERQRKALRATKRTRLLGALALLLALASAGLWGLLTYGPDLPQAEMARTLLSRNIPQWQNGNEAWLGSAAVALGALFLVGRIRIARLRRRIAACKAQFAELGATLEQARQLQPPAVGDEENAPAPPAAGAGDAQVREATDAPERPDESEFRAVRDALDAGTPMADAVRTYADREVAWLGQLDDRLRQRRIALDEQIDQAKERAATAKNLSEVLADLDGKQADIEREITDRAWGIELLEGAVGYISQAFNHGVKELIGSLLPQFTDGRYEHLQLDDDLKVRVFSREKRDFMDLDEVSGGTQRQIMLALRLALSRKMLSRTTTGRQFVFLDEPFAFFDEARTCRTLETIAGLDDEFRQVWIVAQEFPEGCGVSFDLQIVCDRTSESLVVHS